MKIQHIYLKAFYFTLFIAMASIVPYLSLLYEKRGFTGAQIGILTSVPLLINIGSTSLWSVISDITRQQKRMMLFGLCATFGIGTSMLYDWSFYPLLLVVTALFFCTSPTISLTDSLVVKTLGNDRQKYGRIRLWGSVGWILGATFIGWMIDDARLGLNGIFLGFGVGILITILLSLRIGTDSAEFKQKMKWKDFGLFFKNKSWISFLLLVTMIGFSRNIITTYLSIYMDEMGATTIQIGYAHSLSAISEIGIFFFASNLLKRFSAQSVLLASLAFFGVRMLLMGETTDIWILIFIQLLHSITFATSWIAGVDFANQLSPKGLETTGQGLFATFSGGIGGAIGSYSGGYLSDRMELAEIYTYVGWGVLWIAVIYSLFILGYRKKRPSNRAS